MNLRALALGALIGFLFALTPSCGGGQGTCDGCVDETGACVKARDVSARACGAEGATCQACGAGQLCQAGACVAETGGPVTSTCKEPCPDGCCDSSGACQTGRTAAACGSGGKACAACAQAQVCAQQGSSWACQGAAVGTACTDDAQCQALLGAAGVCKRATTSGSAGYPDGYCTLLCGQQSAQCPAGSTCVMGTEVFGEDDQFCWDNCAPGGGSTDACRPGYTCYPLNQQGTVNACWLEHVPDPNAPAGFSGKACQSDGGCGEPPYESVCVQDALPDGGEAFPGGLCTAGCAGMGADFCGPDGVCVNGYFVSSTGQPIAACFRACDNVPDGQAEVPDGGCRTEYVCQPFRETDGGLASDGFCIPTCELQGCGPSRVCATEGAFQGYCLRPDGGL